MSWNAFGIVLNKEEKDGKRRDWTGSIGREMNGVQVGEAETGEEWKG